MYQLYHNEGTLELVIDVIKEEFVYNPVVLKKIKESNKAIIPYANHYEFSNSKEALIQRAESLKELWISRRAKEIDLIKSINVKEGN